MRRVNDLPSELKIAHPVQFDFRSKSEASAMSKFLRVEGNADSYLKDGLAMRFTADYKDISALALNVMLWLSRNAKATHLLLENGGILHESDDVELMRYIHLLPQLRVEVGENTPNVSSGGFKAMKILGRLGAPFKNTRFEVQIVLKDNRNERGGFSHHTYEVARHIANITRTMDACPEDVFQKLVEQASVRSGKKVDTIIAELTGGKKSRVLYATAKSRRAIRVLSPKIYDDWYIKGWIPEDAYREVRRLPKKDSKAPST